MKNCERCVHYDHEGRNTDYCGNCEDCKRNPNYTDWFYSEDD